MPAVPKPGHVAKTERAPRAARARKASVKPIVAQAAGDSHPIPTKGKTGAWLAEIKTSGGITKQAIVEGCVARGLKATMSTAITAYCRRLTLLKEA